MKERGEIRRLVTAVVSAVLFIAAASCVPGGPTPEDRREVQSLRSDLEQLNSEISAAEQRSASLAGGLVKALVEVRVEILKTTESLIQQRIQAIESGAKIAVEISGTEPNLELASQLQEQIDIERVALNEARVEAAKYSGGLVAAMKQAAIATQEQSVAMLRQQYLAAKYGLFVPTPDLAPRAAPDQGAVSVLPLPNLEPDIASQGDVSTEIIAVKLLSKRFAKQEYQDFVWFDIEFVAEGLDKPSRAIKGVLNLQDLFGEPHMRINWTIDEPVKPSESVVENGKGFEFNQFLEPHLWIRSTDLKDMTASFTVKSILYQDGSRLDL